jgi:plasmid stability protein
MATLYVRDVPERLYKRLRASARRNGRSLNAEVIELLDEVTGQEQDAEAITRELAELAAEINWPADAPPPEQFIREARDSR